MLLKPEPSSADDQSVVGGRGRGRRGRGSSRRRDAGAGAAEDARRVRGRQRSVGCRRRSLEIVKGQVAVAIGASFVEINVTVVVVADDVADVVDLVGAVGRRGCSHFDRFGDLGTEFVRVDGYFEVAAVDRVVEAAAVVAVDGTVAAAGGAAAADVGRMTSSTPTIPESCGRIREV